MATADNTVMNARNMKLDPATNLSSFGAPSGQFRQAAQGQRGTLMRFVAPAAILFAVTALPDSILASMQADAKERKAYEKCESKLSECEKYLKRYPRGYYSLKAVERVWESYQSKGSVEAYARFVRSYGAYETFALKAHEAIAFLRLGGNSALQEYRSFLDQFPESDRQQEVKSLVWALVRDRGRESEYQQYLKLFPESVHAADALQRIWNLVEKDGSGLAYRRFLTSNGLATPYSNIAIDRAAYLALGATPRRSAIYAYLKSHPKGERAGQYELSVWNDIRTADDPVQYAEYQKYLPYGPHVAEAKRREQYLRAKKSSDPGELQRFLADFPTADEAEELRETLWAKVDKTDTASLIDFASAFPDTNPGRQALHLLKAASQTAYETVVKSDSVEDMENYLYRFPDSPHHAELTTALKTALLTQARGGSLEGIRAFLLRFRGDGEAKSVRQLYQRALETALHRDKRPEIAQEYLDVFPVGGAVGAARVIVGDVFAKRAEQSETLKEETMAWTAYLKVAPEGSKAGNARQRLTKLAAVKRHVLLSVSFRDVGYQPHNPFESGFTQALDRMRGVMQRQSVAVGVFLEVSNRIGFKSSGTCNCKVSGVGKQALSLRLGEVGGRFVWVHVNATATGDSSYAFQILTPGISTSWHGKILAGGDPRGNTWSLPELTISGKSDPPTLDVVAGQLIEDVANLKWSEPLQ